MSSALDGLTVREKAAAILNGRKLQELERHGLTVIERSELERYRKVEAAATEIFGNFQMGRPNYWELYKDPPEEFLKLHDALYQEASDGREWAVVERQKLEAVLEAARVVVHRWMIAKEEPWDFARLQGALEAMGLVAQLEHDGEAYMLASAPEFDPGED